VNELDPELCSLVGTCVVCARTFDLWGDGFSCRGCSDSGMCSARCREEHEEGCGTCQAALDAERKFQEAREGGA
jgi:hypothetical protein